MTLWLLLALTRCPITEKIETGFADSDDARMDCQFLEPFEIVRDTTVVGMNSCRGPDERVTLRQFDRSRCGVEIIGRTDSENARYARCDGAIDHLLTIDVELLGVEVRMAISEVQGHDDIEQFSG